MIDEDQMIGQIDGDSAEKIHRLAGCGQIGFARVGAARRVIMRHQHGRGAPADQPVPAGGRDRAAAVDTAFAAFDPHQASEAVESGEDQSLAVGGKLGAQQIAGHRILRVAIDEAAQRRAVERAGRRESERHCRNLRPAPACAKPGLGRNGARSGGALAGRVAAA